MSTTHHATSTPLNETNAIEAAMFNVTLRSPPTPAQVQAIRTALAAFSAELPGDQPMQAGGLVFAVGSAPPPVGEVVRFRARPDGTHEWRVQLTGQMLHVSCFRYTSFTDVWGQALRYLQAMLAAVDGNEGALEIGHGYVDKFTYPDGMSAEQYSVNELIREDSPYLTAKARESGLFWHVYQGWFEPTGVETARVLHQLNITNTEVGAPGKVASLIEHRCFLRTGDGGMLNVAALREAGDDGVCRLSVVMRDLHDRHMALLQELLQPAKLKQIGVEG